MVSGLSFFWAITNFVLDGSIFLKAWSPAKSLVMSSFRTMLAAYRNPVHLTRCWTLWKTRLSPLAPPTSQLSSSLLNRSHCRCLGNTTRQPSQPSSEGGQARIRIPHRRGWNRIRNFQAHPTLSLMILRRLVEAHEEARHHTKIAHR